MTATMAPNRTLQQRRDALERANEIRSYRAQLKRDVKAGEVMVPGLLLQVPPELETMRIQELLRAIPRWGRVKTDRTLRRWAISPSKTVGGLSDRQRAVLVTVLTATMRA
jgi:hypothetical protein